MDALLKALKEAFKDTNIHEEDFILECVESVITTKRYGSKYDFNELPCVDSVDDILEIVINRIEEDMKNYPQILKKLDKEKEKFHIHGYEFGSILISEIDVIFYVCSHC